MFAKMNMQRVRYTCALHRKHFQTKRKRSCDLKGTEYNPEIMLFFANTLVKKFFK